jgi:hypothetical protein
LFILTHPAVAQIAELKFGKDRKRKFREYFVVLEAEAVKYYDNPPDLEKPRGLIPLEKGMSGDEWR